MMDMLPDGWALIDPGEARSGSPPRRHISDS